MDTKKVQKCGFVGNDLTFCQAMDRYAMDSGTGYKGVFVVQVSNMKYSNGYRDIGLRMKNGQKDNGVMLNSCPFCLQDIRGWDRPWDESLEAKSE